MPARKVYEVSGSVMVSLPPSVRDETGIDDGMTVIVAAEDGHIRIDEAEITEAHRAQGDND